MNHEKINKREKRVYDEAFRREAVALLQSSDHPLVQIAAELGVSQRNLRDWRKQYGDLSGRRKRGKTAAAAEQSELERLRHEIQNLKMQRDILKKALGILAEPSGNASRA